MGGLEGAEGITGYDEVDEATVFNGGYLPGSSKGPSEGRKRGKTSLSSSTTHSGRSRRGRSMGGFSFRGFSFNIRGFEDVAKTMLAASVAALVLCALILYLTFGANVIPAFYGSLAASIVVVALVFFTASRIIGGSG